MLSEIAFTGRHISSFIIRIDNPLLVGRNEIVKEREMEDEKNRCFPWERFPIEKLDDFMMFLLGCGLVLGAWLVGDNQLASQLSSALLGAITMYLKGKE